MWSLPGHTGHTHAALVLGLRATVQSTQHAAKSCTVHRAPSIHHPVLCVCGGGGGGRGRCTRIYDLDSPLSCYLVAPTRTSHFKLIVLVVG